MNLDAQMGNLPLGKANPRDKKGARDAQRKQLLGRNGPSGARKLRALSQRHLQILAMHLTGEYTGIEIAQEVGCSAGTVYSIINDPMSKTIIEQFRQGQLADLEALMPKAIMAVRDGLDSNSEKIRLLAVDRFVKLKGQDEEDGGRTNVSLTIVDARRQFVERMRDITPVEVRLDAGGTTSTAPHIVEAGASDLPTK